VQKRGRSAAFADPARTALQARHVWLPEAGTSALPAIAHQVDTSALRASTVFIPTVASLEHILVEPNGRQNVVLRGNSASLQLSVTGADLLAGPVNIQFLVPGVDAIGRATGQLATVRRMLSPTLRPSPLPTWTRAKLRLRDALVTLDGFASGASYRDIATLLHGRAYVERNWETGLKDRMRRHLRRGLVLSQQSYRDLIK
jgi:hypothetical protein